MRIKVIIERFKAIAFPIKLGHKGQVDGLLPCPFCGCDTATVIDKRDVDVFDDGELAARFVCVECDHCGAQGGGVMCQSKRYKGFDDLPQMARDRWNERSR